MGKGAVHAGAEEEREGGKGKRFNEPSIMSRRMLSDLSRVSISPLFVPFMTCSTYTEGKRDTCDRKPRGR